MNIVKNITDFIIIERNFFTPNNLIIGSNSADVKSYPTPKTSNPTKPPIDSSVGFDLLEFPFVTLKKFPRGYIQKFGTLDHISFVIKCFI